MQHIPFIPGQTAAKLLTAQLVQPAIFLKLDLDLRKDRKNKAQCWALCAAKTKCHLPHFTGEKHIMKQLPQHNQHGSEAGVGQPQRTLQPRDERGDGLPSPLLQMESEREDKDKTFSKSCRDISLCLCVHIYISAEWESQQVGEFF